MSVVTETVRKLDLGCGMKLDPGYITADIAGQPQVRCTATSLPFADASFDEVRMHHVLEHIPRELLIPAMNEVHRVLISGGHLDIEVPVFPYWTAIADPTHVSFFVPQTFDYFNIDHNGNSAGDAWGDHRGHMALYGIQPWRVLRRIKFADGQLLKVYMEKVCAS